MDVKFLRGLYSNYSVLANAGTANADAFYITGPSNGVYDSIYLGSHLLGTTLASGIKLTGFDLGEGKSTAAGLSASDTVLSAIQKLDLALANATGADNAVISFGGKTGAITISEAGEGHNVSFTMEGNELRGNVDLTAYVTSATLGTTLNNYVTNNALGERLSGYVTSNSLTETLKDYALDASVVHSVATGTANGTISVDGEDVAVKGLGSAAFTDSSAYQPAGDYQPAGNYQEALTAGNYINIDENNNISTVQGSFATADAEKVEGLATVDAVETYVEAYVESQFAAKLTWGSF